MSDEQAAPFNNQVDGRHDFDFFLGEWRVANRKLADPLVEGSGSRRWLEFEATAMAEPILVGLGNYNTYSARDFPGYPGFEGFAVRLLYTETGLWRIWWASTIGVASSTGQWSVASGTARAGSSVTTVSADGRPRCASTGRTSRRPRHVGSSPFRSTTHGRSKRTGSWSSLGCRSIGRPRSSGHEGSRVPKSETRLVGPTASRRVPRISTSMW